MSKFSEMSKFLRAETKLLRQKFSRSIFTEKGVNAYNSYNAESCTARACGHMHKMNKTHHKRVEYMVGQIG